MYIDLLVSYIVYLLNENFSVLRCFDAFCLGSELVGPELSKLIIYHQYNEPDCRVYQLYPACAMLILDDESFSA